MLLFKKRSQTVLSHGAENIQPSGPEYLYPQISLSDEL